MCGVCEYKEGIPKRIWTTEQRPETPPSLSELTERQSEKCCVMLCIYSSTYVLQHSKK